MDSELDTKFLRDEIQIGFDEETMAVHFIYKGVRIKLSREFIEDCKAQTNAVSLETAIVNEYNKNITVIRDKKIQRLINE